ncbi:MAG: ATP synthase F1 subunit epsilon [Candidatus Kerfeldbacteria bacterium]|nr:ATP synthase F1 subunit epsilon [Candidatus Kerfeldbacteria bacterium]
MTQKILSFQIATPERVVFNAEAVESVSLPTKMGEITILPDHLPLVASLVPGEVRVKVGGQEISLAVSGGFIEVAPGRVVVLADTAERAEEIDVKRAEEARERARQLMKREHIAEEIDYTALAARLEKELARLKVVRRHRERKHLSIKVEE